eukprot:3934668-Rhodomonas_salina.1
MAAPISAGSPRGSIPRASHSSAMTRRPRFPPPISPLEGQLRRCDRACVSRACQQPPPSRQQRASGESIPGTPSPRTCTVVPAPPPRNCNQPSPRPPF